MAAHGDGSRSGEGPDTRVLGLLDVERVAAPGTVAPELVRRGFDARRFVGVEEAIAYATSADLAALIIGVDGTRVEDSELRARLFARAFPEIPVLALVTTTGAAAAATFAAASLPFPFPDDAAALRWLKAGPAATRKVDVRELDAYRILCETLRAELGELKPIELDLLARRTAHAVRSPDLFRFDDPTLPVGDGDSGMTAREPGPSHERPVESLLGQFVLARPQVESGANPYDDATMPAEPADFIGVDALSATSTLLGDPRHLLDDERMFIDPKSRVARAVRALLAARGDVADPALVLSNTQLWRALKRRLPVAPTVLVALSDDDLGRDLVGALLTDGLRIEVAQSPALMLAGLGRRRYAAVIGDARAIRDATLAARVAVRAQGAPVFVVDADADRRADGVTFIARGTATSIVQSAMRASIAARGHAVGDEGSLFTFLGAPEEGALLAGSLAEVDPVDLAVALHVKCRTAFVEILGARGLSGTLELVGGQIVHAIASDGRAGERAVLALLLLDAGWYRSSYGRRAPRPPNVAQSTAALIVEAQRASE